MKSHEEIYAFLQAYQIGVISTVSPQGLPNAAIVGFGQTKDLAILFGTDNTSRKYHNLKTNPQLAFTVGGKTAETVQLEGTARELAADELHLVSEHYWRKNPHAKSYHQNPTNRYFIITPRWLRYTDLRTDPWDITELSF